MANRLPRYRRSETPPNIRNFVAYIPLLKMISDFHYMNTPQIVALAETCKTNTYDKLQKLYHNGLVERLYYPQFGDTFPTLIYALTRKGADILRDLEPEKYNDVYYPRDPRSYIFVKHELMISNIRAVLLRGLREKSNGEVTAWAVDQAIIDLFPKLKNHRLIPDGYFAVKTKKGTVHYFIEADRGTMTVSRFNDKITRYRLFFRKNRKELPARFRVLTVTPTPPRTTNLRKIALDNKEDKASRFVFCDETQFSLESPLALLRYII
jgi:hypothetical protein